MLKLLIFNLKVVFATCVKLKHQLVFRVKFDTILFPKPYYLLHTLDIPVEIDHPIPEQIDHPRSLSINI
jgi:hypothetical protein